MKAKNTIPKRELEITALFLCFFWPCLFSQISSTDDYYSINKTKSPPLDKGLTDINPFTFSSLTITGQILDCKNLSGTNGVEIRAKGYSFGTHSNILGYYEFSPNLADGRIQFYKKGYYIREFDLKTDTVLNLCLTKGPAKWEAAIPVFGPLGWDLAYSDTTGLSSGFGIGTFYTDFFGIFLGIRALSTYMDLDGLELNYLNSINMYNNTRDVDLAKIAHETVNKAYNKLNSAIDSYKTARIASTVLLGSSLILRGFLLFRSNLTKEERNVILTEKKNWKLDFGILPFVQNSSIYALGHIGIKFQL